jgi:transcriptional regulator with XRE-family HTH domain
MSQVPVVNDLASRFDAALRRLGILQRDAAAEIGISPTLVSRILSRQATNVSQATIGKVEAWLRDLGEGAVSLAESRRGQRLVLSVSSNSSSATTRTLQALNHLRPFGVLPIDSAATDESVREELAVLAVLLPSRESKILYPDISGPLAALNLAEHFNRPSALLVAPEGLDMCRKGVWGDWAKNWSLSSQSEVIELEYGGDETLDRALAQEVPRWIRDAVSRTG